MSTLGFVVVEWNQASHQPRLVDTDLLDYDDALDLMKLEEAERAKSGRREYYAIAQVVRADER